MEGIQMKHQLDRVRPIGIALVVAAALAAPATAQETREKAQAATREAKQEAREASQETKAAAQKTGNAITDSWITMKVHSQFVPEDALEDSDIDVETKAGVVTLMGTVETAAGKTRAVAIAKATDGVKSVNDRLRIVPDDDDVPAAAPGAAGAAAREGARETRDAGRKAGGAVSDGWLTSKIYSQFITEDALEDSDIDVDVDNGVVTLKGSVVTKAGATRAAAIAQQTDGVKSVKNNLTVKASK
jgi:hyperosmotically inducible protein